MAEIKQSEWRGFDSIGTRVEGGWEFQCDGMPTLRGCFESVQISRKWSRVGLKKGSGWLVIYGDDGTGAPDKDVVLTFCPSCAKHVLAEMQKQIDADIEAKKAARKVAKQP